MSEHVGHAATSTATTSCCTARCGRTGRLLNHAISSVGGSKLGRASFIGRYVFPDGELIDVGESVLAMERAGFEVRDVESLREHYARTLRAWVANLEAAWDEAVRARRREPGAGVAAVHGRLGDRRSPTTSIAIHQVLGVVPTADGRERHAPDRAVEAFESVRAAAQRRHDLRRPTPSRGTRRGG